MGKSLKQVGSLESFKNILKPNFLKYLIDTVLLTHFSDLMKSISNLTLGNASVIDWHESTTLPE